MGLAVRIILLVLCALANLTSNAQAPKKERKVIPLLTPQTFYLNGGTRAAFGGTSRTWYQITLPPNTVEWYYSLSTTRGPSSSATLELVPQLSNLLDPTGFTAIAASAIMTPTGAGVCDVRLMDRPNTDAFIQKIDQNGGKYYWKV